MNPEMNLETVGKFINQKVEENATNIENLPEEVLVIILRKLPIADRVKCERVNRRWRVVARYSSWNKMKHLNSNSVSWGLLPKGKRHEIPEINPVGVESILKRCGKYLKSIEFMDYKNKDKYFLN